MEKRRVSWSSAVPPEEPPRMGRYGWRSSTQHSPAENPAESSANNLWDMALAALENEEPEVLAKYRSLVKSSMTRKSTETGTKLRRRNTSSDNASAKQLPVPASVEQWLRESKEGILVGDDHNYATIATALRSLKDTLISLIQKSPEASIAWTALCLSIQKNVCYGPRPNPFATGITYIASRMAWYVGLARNFHTLSDSAVEASSAKNWYGGNEKDEGDGNDDNDDNGNEDDEDGEDDENDEDASIGEKRFFKSVLLFLIRTTQPDNQHGTPHDEHGHVAADMPYMDEEAPRAKSNEGVQLERPEAIVIEQERALILGPRGRAIESWMLQLFDAIKPQKNLGILEDEVESEENEASRVASGSETNASTEEVEESIPDKSTDTKLQAVPQQPLQQGSKDFAYLGGVYEWVSRQPQYIGWLNESRYRVLWVRDHGGMDKTTVLRAIGQHLQRDTSLGKVAYSFFDWKRYPRHGSVTSILKDLILLTLQEQPGLETHLNDILQDSQDCFTGGDDDSCDFYSMSILFHRIVQDASFSATCFIVDGLDEFCADVEAIKRFTGSSTTTTDNAFTDAWGVENFLRLVSTTSQLSGKVKWLVSSTNEELVALGATILEVTTTAENMCLGADSLMQSCIHLGRDDETIAPVLKKYVQSQIAALEDKAPYRSNLRVKIGEMLQNHSHGNFLWIKLACASIDSSGTPWNGPQTIGRLGDNLQSLYCKTNEDIAKLEGDDQSYCEAILSTMTVAFRPLSVSELAALTELPPDVDLPIMASKLCWPFLTHHEGYICFSDNTAKDFLLRPKTPAALVDGHANMVSRCLSYQKTRFSLPHKRDEEGVATVEDDDDYTAVSWIRHLTYLPPEHAVMAIADEFMKNHFLSWVTKLDRLGVLKKAWLYMRTLLKILLQKSSQESLVPDLIETLRVVTYFMAYHHYLEGPIETTIRIAPLVHRDRDRLQGLIAQKDLPTMARTSRVSEDVGVYSYLHVLTGHTDWVRDCAYSPDSSLVASASDDYTVRLWDSKTGKLQCVLPGKFDDYVYHVAFSPARRGLVSAASRNDIRFWDVATGLLVKHIPSTSLRLRLLDWDVWARKIYFSPDGSYVVATNEGGECSLELPSFKDRPGQQCLEEGGAPWDATYLFKYSADGSLQARHYSKEKRTVVWNCREDKLHCQVEDFSELTFSFAFSPDATVLASAHGGGIIRILDSQSGNCLQLLHDDDNKYNVDCIAFSPTGSLLATASGSTVFLWKVEQPGNPRKFQDRYSAISHDSSLTAIEFSPSGHQLVTTERSWAVHIWSLDAELYSMAAKGSQQNSKPRKKNHLSSVSCVMLSHDGKMLASASGRGDIILWDAFEEMPLHNLVGHDRSIYSLQFSADNSLLVSASADGTARVWDTSAGRPRFILKGHSDWVRHAVFSLDSRFVATASDDCTIRMWDLKGCLVQEEEEGREREEKAAANSPEMEGKGREIPIRRACCVLRSSSPRYRSSRFLFQSGSSYRFSSWFRNVAISPNGRYLAGADARLNIWELHQDDSIGAAAGTIQGKEIEDAKNFETEGKPYGLAFTPNSEALVCSSSDGALTVWSTQSWKRLGLMEHFTRPDASSWCFPVRLMSVQDYGHQPYELQSEVNDLALTLPDSAFSPLAIAPGDVISVSSRNFYGVCQETDESFAVTWKNKILLQLPKRYRPSDAYNVACCVRGSMVAIGCTSGEVFIFRFAGGQKLD